MRAVGLILLVIAVVMSSIALFSSEADGQAGVDYVRHEETGDGQAWIYPVQLEADEVIAGYGYRFNDQGGGCKVFLVVGPFSGDITVESGEWWQARNVNALEQDGLVYRLMGYFDNTSCGYPEVIVE